MPNLNNNHIASIFKASKSIGSPKRKQFSAFIIKLGVRANHEAITLVCALHSFSFSLRGVRQTNHNVHSKTLLADGIAAAK